MDSMRFTPVSPPSDNATSAVIPGTRDLVRPPVIPVGGSGRREQRKTYTHLRDLGYSDAEAQALLTPQRETQRQRRKVETQEQQIAALVPRFTGPARAYLSRGGCYREDAVPQVARAMAERSLLLEQPPLLQSPETLLLPSVAGGMVPATTGFPKTDYRRIFPLPGRSPSTSRGSSAR